jgi:hypothetical protein
MNKIPVKNTIAAAYRFTFGGVGKIIGLIWLPAVLITAGGYFCMLPYFNFMANNPDPKTILQHGSMMGGLYGFYLAAIVLFAVIVVAITREVLQPTNKPVLVSFPFGGDTFRVIGSYIGLIGLILVFAIGAGLLVGASALIAKLVPGAGDAVAGTVVGLAAVIGVLALIYIAVRLGFLMVPAAVTEGKFGLERSWQMTRGNFWRIVLIALGTALPVLLVTLVAEVAILGPDYFNPHIELIANPEAMARHNAEQMRAMAAHFPVLMGFSFFLMPFTYGLSVSSAAFAYRALKEQTPAA